MNTSQTGAARIPGSRGRVRLAGRRDVWTPVVQHMLQPLLWVWRRDRTLRYVPTVERLLSLPPDVARRRTLARIRALLVHARETVPFWRRRLQEVGFEPESLERLDDLQGLPPLTRDDVGHNIQDMISRRYRKRRLYWSRSGGTTSRALPFTSLPEAMWLKAAASTVLRRRMGWHPGDRVAMLWGDQSDFPATSEGLLRTLKARLMERHVERLLWLPAYQLDDAVLDGYVDTLERFRPMVLQAYPSAADLLARRILETGRRLDIPMALLTAETVFPAQRARIHEALGCEVFTFYGAREVGWIAEECPRYHSLHLNTAGVHVEAEADGRLLVSDLTDPAAPLIRYAVGDRGRLATEPCPCGDPRPVLADLHGRVSDVFTLPSGRRVPGVVPDIGNYQMDSGVLECQAIQHEPGRFEIRYVAAPTFEPHHETGLREHFDKAFFGEGTFEMVRVDRIEPEPNGKVRYSISHVPEFDATA